MKWLIFLTCLLVMDAFAFNWNKCNSNLARSRNTSFWGSNFSTSSSQFTTSTGDCAMIGQVEHDQKVFLALNLDKIKIDAARGGGEYLEAYTQVAQMSKLDLQNYFAKVQRNYSFIFQNEDIDGIQYRMKL